MSYALRILQRICSSFHGATSLILVALLVPALHAAHLPLCFTWAGYFRAYWLVLAVQSVLTAALLYVAGFPEEFLSRIKGRGASDPFPKAEVTAILLPAIYFFFAFILVFSYNDIIASLRFNGSSDVMLSHIDSWMLGGGSVTAIAHSAMAHLPPRTFVWMEFVYFGLFRLVGACLILLALRDGRRRAMQFIATTITAYYLSLILFFLLPATGPYYVYPIVPISGGLYRDQLALIQRLDTLRAHLPIDVIGTDYYLAFPCMHLTQPLIMLWFARKWKGVAIVLAAYTLFLIPSILLLEQHYVVDLIGGVLVAIVAVAMMEGAGSKLYSTPTVAKTAVLPADCQ